MEKKKIILFGIIIIIIMFLLAVFIYIRKSNNLKCGSAGISYEEFEKIQTGDSEFTVHSIIDEKDKWDNNAVYNKCVILISKENHNSVYSHTYKYIGKNGGYALITYTADYSNGDIFVLPVVSKKEQFNLK